MKSILRQVFCLGISLSFPLLVGCPPKVRIIEIPQPQLSNPILVDTNADQKCAIDDTGLHCWGTIYTYDSSLAQVWEQSGLTQLNIAVTNPKQLTLESSGLCVVGDTEAFCQRTLGWVLDAFRAEGLTNAIPSPRYARIPMVEQYQFSQPSVIKTDSYFFPICVINALGVECNDQFAIIPALNNPTVLDVGEKHGCAIDVNGLHCWKLAELLVPLPSEHLPALEAAITVPTDLVNPSQVAVGYLSTCVVDERGVHCWGGVNGTSPAPPLNLPTQVVWGAHSSGFNHYCALDTNGVTCWEDVDGSVIPAGPALSNPTQIAAGPNSACVIDDTGVVCWEHWPYSRK